MKYIKNIYKYSLLPVFSFCLIYAITLSLPYCEEAREMRKKDGILRSCTYNPLIETSLVVIFGTFAILVQDFREKKK